MAFLVFANEPSRRDRSVLELDETGEMVRGRLCHEAFGPRGTVRLR
jgi:hypothetical protein